MSVVDALAREVGSVGQLLHTLKPKQWEQPTRCPPMNVRELAAHMMRGAGRIQEMLDAGPVDAEPERDGITYFQSVTVSGEIVKRAQEASAAFPPDLARAWDLEWTKALQRARMYINDDPVLRNVYGLIRLTEYLKTRCVEAVIHHMDLDDALGRKPHPDREALEITGDILRGLLGTDLRPVGVDDVRFALIGTGRAPLNDDERQMLGPLAQKFPLFS
ncbi:MAG: maleylpyruvate isomerase family mycothiol-dependent enzyme [Actinobacteria bacterium]|nr:MAG: maleylpyruvate isomerase family mycothiol-dependent enzyme [Actinomycetota bacterium]